MFLVPGHILFHTNPDILDVFCTIAILHFIQCFTNAFCSNVFAFTVPPPYSSEKAKSQMFLRHFLLTNGLVVRCHALLQRKHDTAIEGIIKGFDSTESSSIRVVMGLFSYSLSEILAYIKSGLE